MTSKISFLQRLDERLQMKKKRTLPNVTEKQIINIRNLGSVLSLSKINAFVY